ncbi:YadA-like family protein [Bartonella sp. OT172YNZD]|uniref:YadA-like family protein n=1 Tax=Bartonella sp. OT172YNZD TaxID=3243572 RepID=UPI0035D05FF3
MKKKHITSKTPEISNLKNSCSPYGLPFIKTLSLVSVAVFLSSASPVSATGWAFNNISDYLGGGADVLKSVAPTYIIDGNVYRDVGSAFIGVENQFKGLEANMGNTIKLEVGTAVNNAFAGWGNTWGIFQREINNKINTILSDMIVKQDAVGTITIGAKKGGYIVNVANNSRETRFITGVRDGLVNATSDHAVNGSQLYKLGAGVASSFGGGAGYKDGNWNAPTFTVKVFDQNGNGNEKNYNNVADALSGVSSSFTNLDKKIENIVVNATGDGLVKQDGTGLITIGGKVNGAKVTIANVDNAVRTLTGVRAGSITATSTDAINGSQLYSMSNVVAGYFGGGAGYKDGSWSAPTFTVKVFDKNGNGAEKNYKNVADAFTGVSSSFTNLDKKIENIVVNATGDTLVKQDGTGLITIGGQASGNKVSIANIFHGARVLTGVGNGKIGIVSTDAVNGSQLYMTGFVVACSFGGGAGYDKDGNWTLPTFTIKVFDKDGNGAEKNYRTVEDAFTGVSSSFTNLDKKIENIVINAAGDSLVKQDDAGLISIGGKVSGTKVSIANIDNAVRTLSGVNAGSITATSTDAINGSQFYSMSNVVAGYFSGDAGYDKDGHWISPTFTVKVFDKDGSGTEKNYRTVADAFTGVSSSFTNLNEKIENVTGDSFVKQNSAGLITIGGNKGGNRIDIANSINAPRVLSGVKGGAFTATSTEAVNGAQLYFMAQAFASYFGGGAGYDKDGSWSAPTFTVKAFDKDGNETEKTYSSVADAFAGVNSALTGLNHEIVDIKNNAAIGEKNKEAQNGSDNNITEGFPFRSNLTRALDEVDIVMDEEESDIDEVDLAVSYDVDKESGEKTDKITLKGEKEDEPVLINNVAGGEIKEGSKYAVNGGQLHDYTDKQMEIVLNNTQEYTDNRVDKALNEAKAYTDMKFEALSYDIQNVRKEARQAAAIGLAVSNLRYFDDPGSLSVSFGGGLWRGQSAFAIGAGYTSEDGKIRSNLSATSAGGQWGVGGGITLKLK